MNDNLAQLAIGAVVATGAVVCGLYAAHKYRAEVRDRVQRWLHQNNLEKTALTDVLFVCDNVAGQANKFTCKIFVKTKEKGEQKVSENTYSLEELKKVNPDIAAQMESRQHSQKSILKLVT